MWDNIYAVWNATSNWVSDHPWITGGTAISTILGAGGLLSHKRMKAKLVQEEGQAANVEQLLGRLGDIKQGIELIKDDVDYELNQLILQKDSSGIFDIVAQQQNLVQWATEQVNVVFGQYQVNLQGQFGQLKNVMQGLAQHMLNEGQQQSISLKKEGRQVIVAQG